MLAYLAGLLADIEFCVMMTNEETTDNHNGQRPPPTLCGDDASGSSSPTTSTAATIANNTTLFKAHKVILIARSPFWAAQFRSGMKESQSTDQIARMTITNISPKVFAAVLRWIYTDEINLDDKSDNNTIATAVKVKSLNLKSLRNTLKTLRP
jgi:hypothetical protein